MSQYIYLLEQKYAVVYWLKMSQYIYIRRCLLALNVTGLSSKYAVVHWLKMSQYIYFFVFENTPLFTGLKCHSTYIFWSRNTRLFTGLTCHGTILAIENTPLFTGLKCHSIYIYSSRWKIRMYIF